MSNQRPKVVAIVILSVALFALSVFCGYREITRDRYEIPRGQPIGDDWLRMTPPEKFYFVVGYAMGSRTGYREACELSNDLFTKTFPAIKAPENIILDPCDKQRPLWSKGAYYVVKQVDEFYSRYPSDQNLHLTNLIQNLSDQSDLTIEQIHALGNH